MSKHRCGCLTVLGEMCWIGLETFPDLSLSHITLRVIKSPLCMLLFAGNHSDVGQPHVPSPAETPAGKPRTLSPRQSRNCACCHGGAASEGQRHSNH